MKNIKSLNLIRIFLLKERVFWNRTWTMRKRTGWLGFLIGLLFITVAHYAFAIMHFLFECFLWVVKRPQFKVNLQKMQTQMA